MSLIPKLRDNNSRYKVRIVDPKSKEYRLTPISKNKLLIRNIFDKGLSIFLALVVAGMALLGTIGTAAPAQAGNFIEDGFKGAFCSQGLFFYELEYRALGPTTGDEKDPNATPYEKYGVAGTSWTVWLGPESQEGLDGKGEFGGKTIVDTVGGESNNGGIDKWGDSVTSKNDVATKFPGFYNNTQTCAPIMEVGGTTVANFLMATTGEVVFITNTIYQVAYETSSSILTSLAPTITNVVTALKDAIYFEFLTVMIMIAALWMAWVGLVKKASIQMAQGAMWMIGAAVASVALMTNPMWLPNIVSSTVSSVSEAGMNAVTTSTTAKGQKNICAVDPTSAPPTSVAAGSGNSYVESKNNTTRNIVRQMQCTIWYSFQYTPWAIGEFGQSPSAMSTAGSPMKASWDAAVKDQKVGGNSVLANTKITPVKKGVNGADVDSSAQNWALYHLDNKIMYPGNTEAQNIDQKRALLNVASAQLHVDSPNLTYKGDGSANRIANASLALIASIGASVMIVIISMSMIVLDVGLVILTLVSPLFFLAGVHPGFGRKVALGWLESVAGLAIKRIVLSLILSVMLVFYATILADTSKMPWIMSMILIIAVSIGGISYKDQIIKMFNKISFGGDGGLQAQPVPGKNALTSGMKKVAGAALTYGAIKGGQKIGQGLTNSGAGPSKAKANGPSQKALDKNAAAKDVQNNGAGQAKAEDTSKPDLNLEKNDGAGAEPNKQDVENAAQDKANNDGAGEAPNAQEVEDAAQAQAAAAVAYKYDENGNERSPSGVALAKIRAEKDEKKQSELKVRAENRQRELARTPKSIYSRAYEKNKISQRKRDIVTGPAGELRSMVSGADKAMGSPLKNVAKSGANIARPVTKRIVPRVVQAGGYVKRTPKAAFDAAKAAPGQAWSATKAVPGKAWSATKAAPGKAGERILAGSESVAAKMETSVDNRNARKEFDREVNKRAEEIKKERFAAMKEKREADKLIPKRYRDNN